MDLALTLVSIVLLTAGAWLFKRMFWSGLCPVCIGVSGTWMGLLVASGMDYGVDPRLSAVLLGGSVVGLAGLGEKHFATVSPNRLLLWKTVFVTVGFATAYALTQFRWPLVISGAAALGALFGLLVFFKARKTDPEHSERVEAIKAQMKHCC